MKNNNEAIVRKLARKSLAASRGRNVFLILAIFLTTFMLGSIISLGVSYMEAQATHLKRLLGTSAHATLSNITDGQIETIKSLDYVSVCSTTITAGIVLDGGFLNGNKVTLAYCDPTEWETFRKPVISNVVGHYPKSDNEIMVPTWVLENLGIDEPQPGMEIALTYQMDGQEHAQVFKLAGYFTSYTLVSGFDTESIFVSQGFVKETGHIADENKSVQILYTGSDVMHYSDLLQQTAQIDTATTHMRVYIKNNEMDPLYAIFTVVGVLLVVAGFLLIYNVMSISVSRDIRYYGLLKTTGMTPRQIRSMGLQQVLRLCLMGIPAGLAFSALVSFVIVPWFIGNTTFDFMRTGGAQISFSPLIYIGAALFSLTTALFGAFRPIKKAADISPVEAVRFAEQGVNLKTLRSKKFSPEKVAWRNVFRVRKRAILVFLSMFIGMTMFLMVGTVLGSTDMEAYTQETNAGISSDIYLKNRLTEFAIRESEITGNEVGGLQVFTPELMEQIRSLPGLYNMEVRYADRIHKTDSGFFDMNGKLHYETDFVYRTDEGEESVIYDIHLYIEKDAQKQALGMIKEWTKKHQYIQWRSGIETREEGEKIVSTLTIFGNSISVILWLIGVLNFVNIIATSIISRRHEIALFQSIGQTPGQTRKMLMAEGFIYAGITLLLVCILGGVLSYGFFLSLASQYNYVAFKFPYVPLLIMFCVVLAICVAIPQWMYRFINKMPLVERLREAE